MAFDTRLELNRTREMKTTCRKWDYDNATRVGNANYSLCHMFWLKQIKYTIRENVVIFLGMFLSFNYSKGSDSAW